MTSLQKIIPSADFRAALKKRGGDVAFRCYQCATCSSVCELAPEGTPFPRKQMAEAQWGLVDQLAADPAVWLCHQCNDCSARCPRDAKPGDVMQTIRSLMVESMSTPKFLGKLVGNAASTWPLLIGLPFLIWIGFIYAVNGSIPTLEPQMINGAMTIAWHDAVPHWMIYAIYIPTTLWVVIAMGISGTRYWNMMGEGVTRSGSFLSNLIPAVKEILTHKRFGSCETARPRKTAHWLFMWGFIGAAFTTGVIVIAMYGFNYPLPVPQMHWMKIVGNISGILLVVGGLWLVVNRLGGGDAVGRSTAFDQFFLLTAVLVGFTGVGTELARLFLGADLALWIYIAHLSFILCLFATFPYCKFAHMVYRTIAMVHERATS